MMFKNKKLIIPLSIVIAILLIIGGVYFYIQGKSSTEKKKAFEANIGKVTIGSITSAVAATGKIVPNLDVDIKCKASGEIVKLPFDVSDKVSKGDLLVQLDPVNENRNVTKSSSSLVASQSRLAQTNKNLMLAKDTLAVNMVKAEQNFKLARTKALDLEKKAKRVKELLKQKLASQEEYETSETSRIQALSDLKITKIRFDELKIDRKALAVKQQDIVSARAQVNVDQTNLFDAQQRLSETKVYSPVNGVVTVRNVQIGQIISSGISNVGGGTSLMTVSDFSRLFVLASVDESDIGKIKLGQNVEITVDAYPEHNFNGRIVRISPKGTNTASVITFETKIEVTDKNKSLLKPEMTANVNIIIAKKSDIVTVPIDSIFYKGKKSFIKVVEKGRKPIDKPVETGVTDGINIEVTNGLKSGDKILLQKDASESKWRNNQRGPVRMGM